MDIYEFTQVLRRQKWLLLGGFTLLVVFIAVVSLDFSGGVKLRTTPKYQADVRMAVVPEGYESLGQDLGSNTLSGPAQVFSALLSSPQAALEISQKQGVRILEFGVSATGRDRFFTATAISDTPEGAVAASLGAFAWLEQRLSDRLVTASNPTATLPEIEVLDADGLFNGKLRLEVDHSLAAGAEGLWIVADSGSGTDVAYRLMDAADETLAEYRVAITPGEDLSVRLEDAAGRPLDQVSVSVPLLPEGANSSYQLLLSLGRGLVRGSADDPLLDSSFLDVSWLPSESGTTAEEPAFSDVGILLLTDEPLPQSIGGRKAPLIMIALLTAGVIGLMVVAVIIDSWSQERRRRRPIDSDLPGASSFARTVDEIDEILGRVSS